MGTTTSTKTTSEPATRDILAALDVIVFERMRDGSFCATGVIPSWFLGLVPDAHPDVPLDLVERFPFLEVFLPECEETWAAPVPRTVQSDLWEERDLNGAERPLQALGVVAGGRSYLVLLSPVATYQQQRVAQQRKNEMALLSELLDKLNQELKIRNQEVERATRAKSDFLAAMSHEIRTPMNAIIGMADLLSNTSLTPEQKKYVEVFQRAGNNLLNLINDILDLSKVESGKVQLESVNFELGEVVSKAIEVLAVRARAKGLAVGYNIRPDVPMYLTGDPSRLQQVLINLLGNSMKFTERGGLEVAVELDPETVEPGALRFAVADSGIGIPEDKRGAIFESFTQADSSTTRKYGGTGLGLAISKQLVELMSGRIWVDSKIGVGSTFFFTAKFGVPANQAPPIAVKPAASELSGQLPAGLRILLADDSEDNRFLILSYLKDTGCSVKVAENGAMAIREFQSGEYDLVLMDVEMPEVDGYTATREIRKLERDKNTRGPVPVLALTAHAFAEAAAKSLEAGFTAHLTKPIRRAALLAALQQHTQDLPSRPVEPVLEGQTANQSNTGKPIRVKVDPSMQDIVPRFLEKRRNDLPRLSDALDRGDFETIRVLGHNLKGCGAGYGFPPLSEIGAEIEQSAKDQHPERIRAKIDELARYLQNVELVAAN